VEKFGGKINFYSEYNEGTTFYFTFPLHNIAVQEINDYKRKCKEEDEEAKE